MARTVVRGKLISQSACATRRTTHAPDGLWISRIRVLEHGVLQGSSHPCSRNIQGRSRSSTRLRSGWIGCSVALGRCKRKGERGSMREKGIDGRHRRGGELPVGRPIGNYSIREHKRGSQYRSGETSSK